MLKRGVWLAAVCAVFIGAAPVPAQSIDIGPAPGRLVDIGGRRLHLDCRGSGSPTVVIEAGASAFALDWSLVQPEIARTRRVCAYDRAGSGWSDARPDVETPARIVADLHALLAAAGEKPPFVLVGHSAGGLYVRLYQLEYPDDIVGMVLVDPASDDRLFTLFEGKPVPIATLTSAQLMTTLPASGPIPIPPRQPQTGDPFDKLPPDLYELRVKLDRRLIASFPAAVSLDIVKETSEGQRAALARLMQSRQRSDAPIAKVPLVVLTRGRDSSSGLVDTHAALARLSSNSRQTVVADTFHEIHLSNPAAVIQAIQDVVAAAEQKSPLAKR